MSRRNPDIAAGSGAPWLPWVVVPFSLVVLAVVGRFVPNAAAVPAEDPWLRDWVWPSLSSITRVLRNGEFPMWNPYQHGGLPLLADPREPVLAPLTWLFVWFPFPDAVLIHGMTCLMGAGFFTVLWMRTMGGSYLSSVFSAAVYLLGPFAAASAARPGLETVCCWLPLACWATVSFFRRPRMAPMVVGMIAMSAMSLSGEPVVAMPAVAAAWLLGIQAGWQIRSDGSRSEGDAHLLVRLVLWIGGVLMLVAPQWLPAARRFFLEGFPSDLIWTGVPACWVLPARSAAVVEHILTPGLGLRWGDPGFTRHLVYIHPLVLLLSVAALAGMRKRSPGLPVTGVAFFLILAIVGGLYFPGSPVWSALALPGQLGVAGLCGLGADRLFGPEPDAKRRSLLILSLFLAGGVYVITGGAGGWQGAAFALCCLVALAWGTPYVGGVFRLALLLVTAVTLHQELVVPMNLPGRLRGLSRADQTALADILQKKGIQGRVAVLPPLREEAVGSRNAGMLLGISFVNGWNHPVSRAADRLLLPPDRGSADGNLDENMLARLRRVYAVNAFVIDPDVTKFLPPGFFRATSRGNGELWVCDQPVSRWALYGQWVAVPRRDSVADALCAADLDAVCVLQLDTEGARILADRMMLEGGTATRPSGGIFPLEDRANRLSLRVQSDRPVLLAVADAWNPDWICYVNGRLTSIIPANGMGRAVMIPAGESTVTFVYAPLLWKLGMASGLVLLAMFCVYGVILLVGNRPD